MEPESNQAKDLAYYYTDWIWSSASSDWMKSLLLFFDGVALALPPAIATMVVDKDPVLAQPLMERGLLTNFSPSSWLDRESAELLARTLLELVRSIEPQCYYRASRLTRAHWGADAAPKIAKIFYEELLARGLVRETKTDRSGVVLMDPRVRQLVLTVFLKVLEACVSRSSEVRLQPTTDRYESVMQHTSFLVKHLPDRDYSNGGHGPYLRRFPTVKGAAMIIGMDLHSVGVDLSSVPLDEALDFRREQGQHYRAYARSLRRFLEEVQLRTDQEYEAAVVQRQEEIVDMADALRREGRKAFGRNSVVAALSLAGAAWTAVRGDPIGAALAAVGAGAGIRSQQIPVSSYSYLFIARNEL